MNLLVASLIVLVALLSPYLPPVAPTEAPTGIIEYCEVYYWDENVFTVDWDRFPAGANLYYTTFRMDDLTANTTLLSATSRMIINNGHLYMYFDFSPKLDPKHTYKMSGIQCTASFGGGDLVYKSDLHTHYLNLKYYLSIIIKKLFNP